MSSTNFEEFAFITLKIDWDYPRKDFLEKTLTSQKQLRAWKYLQSFCKDGKTWRDTLSPADFKFRPPPAIRRRQRTQRLSYKVTAFMTLNIDWDYPRKDFLEKTLTSQKQLRAWKYLQSFCKDGKTWRDTLSPADFKFRPPPAIRRRQRNHQSRLQMNQTHCRTQSSITLRSPDIIAETVIHDPGLKTGHSAATAIDLTIEDDSTTSIGPGFHTQSRAQTKALEKHEITIQALEDQCAKLEDKCAKLEQKCQDLTEAYECKICREQALGLRARLPCKHSFCKDCITKWCEMSKRCPLCRVEFSSADIQYLYL